MGVKLREVLKGNATTGGNAPVYQLKGDGSSDSSAAGAREDVPLQRSTFATLNDDGSSASGAARDYYKPLETYEGFHRYDPDYQWEPKEERRLVRKLDRGNINQALTDNLLQDLHMNQNGPSGLPSCNILQTVLITVADFNTGQTIFYITFLCAELPSQMISKRLGPDRWIPIQMVSWSLVASFQAFMRDKQSYYACRALLGLIEGGFIPDTVLYLTYFYKSVELPTRLSFFWTSYQLTYIVSAFLAYGILHMRGINGLPGWAWLFALEGTLTGLIGVFTYFYLPPSPTQTASYLRGKDGWFTVHEEKILVNRVLRDDPSKGDMHNRQAVDLRMFWKCLTDYDLWPIYFVGLSWMLVNIPVQAYLTLELRQLNFDTFQSNLLSIPSHVLFIINLLFWTWVARRVGYAFLTSIISQAWCLPFLVALVVLPDNASRWARYACTTAVVGYPYLHAVLVASTSRNAGSVRTRTVASALYNMSVQLSNIIGSNIYRDSDKPFYRTGNKALLGILAWNVVAFVGCHLYYLWRNTTKERRWRSMTATEQALYLETTTDEGNKRLDFRFQL